MNNFSQNSDQDLDETESEGTKSQQNDLEEIEYVSKTQLKVEAKALQQFGKELTELSAAKLATLPLSETTQQAITDFHKQSGNIGRKRHLAYIGKCLRNEDADAVKQALQEENFEQQREVKQTQDSVPVIDELLQEGDAKIQSLIEAHEHLDRQKLRQLVRNANKAAAGTKKEAAVKKLAAYLKDNRVY